MPRSSDTFTLSHAEIVQHLRIVARVVVLHPRIVGMLQILHIHLEEGVESNAGMETQYLEVVIIALTRELAIQVKDG